MALSDRIKPKIQKAINKLPSNAVIKRATKNEFGEPSKEETICEVIGLYHDAGETSNSRQDKGKVESSKKHYLMLVYDEQTAKIKKGDFVYLKGEKYEVLDTGNVYQLDAYLDMPLKEVSYHER